MYLKASVDIKKGPSPPPQAPTALSSIVNYFLGNSIENHLTIHCLLVDGDGGQVPLLVFNYMSSFKVKLK